MRSNTQQYLKKQGKTWSPTNITCRIQIRAFISRAQSRTEIY